MLCLIAVGVTMREGKGRITLYKGGGGVLVILTVYWCDLFLFSLLNQRGTDKKIDEKKALRYEPPQIKLCVISLGEK